MSNFKLNIYTPNGKVVEGLGCNDLLIPTTSGIINVLKGHTHVITELDTGILEARMNNGSTRHFTIAGGLCKILGEEATILAKTSEAPESIDIERAKSAKLKAESRLNDGVDSIQTIKFRRKIERAKNRLKVANLK
ncbi:MAG: ATP synthase F1 subunit epsilon [Halobacteriovoraceae bacterium]|nr:ATP synthase F1 subunit epsilon [Halobacteriovoraceae bacterium]|tara:strand:+ start:1822 stop:2229 length:408 start_codon:yes stop_codon:yes gene_type:complete